MSDTRTTRNMPNAALCGNGLHCVATGGTMLQRVALCCNGLNHVATWRHDRPVRPTGWMSPAAAGRRIHRTYAMHGVARGEPSPVQMWQGWAQVPVQMRQGWAQVPPGSDVVDSPASNCWYDVR